MVCIVGGGVFGAGWTLLVCRAATLGSTLGGAGLPPLEVQHVGLSPLEVSHSGLSKGVVCYRLGIPLSYVCCEELSPSEVQEGKM
jgi:hypothetical protein